MNRDQEHNQLDPTESPCVGALHPEARAGLELFNAGLYFEAHEALENAWRDETGPVRDLYRGILQVGVAYHHLLHGNYTGAIKMLARCRQWLDLFPASCRGIDLAALRNDYEAVERALLRLGPQGLGAFDRALLKPVRYT